MPWAAGLLFLAVSGTLLLLGQLLRRADFPGRPSFIGMLLAVAWWNFAAGMENLLPDPAHKLLWAKLAWPGIMLAPSCWALFVWAYVKGFYQPLPKTWLLGVLVMPVLTCALALTNDSHHWIYLGAQPISAEPGAALRYQHGPWFYLAALYLYGYMSLSMLVLFQALAQSSEAYRRHYLGFVLGAAIPWLANAAYLLGLFSLFGFDPTPFAFLVMNGLFYWLIGQRQLFNLLPVAQEVLLNALPDAVLVLDEQARVVQFNHSASQLASLDGLHAGQSLRAYPALYAQWLQWWEQQTGNAALHLGAREYEVHHEPIRYRKRRIGLLLVLHDVSAQRASQRALQRAKQELETELQAKAELATALREAAIRDPLTGLYNRRFIDEIAPKLMDAAERRQRPLAVLLLDLDHFKQVNDRFGHAVGDLLLCRFANLLMQQVRSSDYVCRLGGEEFLILMPDSSEEHALQRAQLWQLQLGELQLPTLPADYRLAFSGGLAIYPCGCQSFNALLQEADEALYLAKHRGRRQVCIADTPASQSSSSEALPG